MPALFRRSVIFADIKNVIVSIDAIVASRIGRFLKENPNYKAFLNNDIVKLSDEPANKLKFIVMADKENKNFLLDYFNWDTLSLSDDIDPFAICDYIYKEVLKMAITKDDILHERDLEPLMTSTGMSFRTLSVDTNLEMVYLYQEDCIPPKVYEGLSIIYRGSNKFKFIQGDKGKFLKTHFCDSYFFEDVSDLDTYIAHKHPRLSEVLIPNASYNLSVVDEVDGLRLRTPSCKMNLADYKSKFNLDVNAIGLPI